MSEDVKLQWHLLPIDALEEVIRVLQFGAEKYGAFDWETNTKWCAEDYDAAMRHLTKWMGGETFEAESGRRHLAHACCRALFMLAHDIREGKDG